MATVSTETLLKWALNQGFTPEDFAIKRTEIMDAYKAAHSTNSGPSRSNSSTETTLHVYVDGEKVTEMGPFAGKRGKGAKESHGMAVLSWLLANGAITSFDAEEIGRVKVHAAKRTVTVKDSEEVLRLSEILA